MRRASGKRVALAARGTSAARYADGLPRRGADAARPPHSGARSIAYGEACVAADAIGTCVDELYIAA